MEKLSKREMGSAEGLSLYDMGTTDELSKHEKSKSQTHGLSQRTCNGVRWGSLFQAHLSDLWEKQRRRAL